MISFTEAICDNIKHLELVVMYEYVYHVLPEVCYGKRCISNVFVILKQNEDINTIKCMELFNLAIYY